jgi:CheY-like chemotaxis protein
MARMDHPERPPRVHVQNVQDVQIARNGDADAGASADQADRGSRALASHEPTPYGGSPRHTTILVAENEATNRHLMEQILRFAGYTTLSATNGREALETLQIRHADLMLVDISMPVLDGYAMLALLREQPTHVAMPVVAVTAHATLEDRQRALNAGFTEYLTKPFRPRDLLRMVERLLARD